MVCEEMKRSQGVLALFLEILKNPNRSTIEVMESLDLEKYKYYRYFDDLSGVVPICYDKKEKRYRFEPVRGVKQFGECPDELYSLLIALSATLKSDIGKPRGIVDSIGQIPLFSIDIDMLSKFVVFMKTGNVDPDLPNKVFTINEAIRDSKMVVFSYKFGDRVIPEIKVAPHKLVFDNAWYLHGESIHEDYGGRKNYKLCRIVEIHKSDECFEMPPASDICVTPISIPWDFSASDDDEPIEVVVEFTGFAVRYIREEKYHDTQKIRDLGDGKIEFRVRVKNPSMMINWLMFYGRNAVVVEPQFLKDALVNEMEETMKHYA
jgi:hypothetical protein